MAEEKKKYKGRKDSRFKRRSGRFRPPFRKKVCHFCRGKIDIVDYKEVDLLRHYMTDRGKILPRTVTGACAKHQRFLTRAIKRARNIGLLPYSAT